MWRDAQTLAAISPMNDDHEDGIRSLSLSYCELKEGGRRDTINSGRFTTEYLTRIREVLRLEDTVEKSQRTGVNFTDGDHCNSR